VIAHDAVVPRAPRVGGSLFPLRLKAPYPPGG
jgi:hypothetical protein